MPRKKKLDAVADPAASLLADSAAPREQPSGTATSARRVTRILIVDDHELLRQGMRDLIAGEHDLEICGEALDEAGAIQQFHTLQPDFMIVDVSLKEGDGINLVKRIHTESQIGRAHV